MYRCRRCGRSYKKGETIKLGPSSDQCCAYCGGDCNYYPFTEEYNTMSIYKIIYYKINEHDEYCFCEDGKWDEKYCSIKIALKKYPIEKYNWVQKSN